MLANLTAIMDKVNSFSGEYTVITALIGVAIGVILCFFGYKLCEFFIGFFTFIMFGLIGVTITSQFNDTWYITLIVFLMLGTIGAVLAIKLYKIGAFIFCFFVTIGAITEAMGSASGLALIVGAVAGIAIGVFAILFTKHVMIILTSVVGAFSIAVNLGGLIKLDGMYIIAISVLVGVVGLATQYLTDRVAPKKIGKKDSVDEDDFSDSKKCKSVSSSEKEDLIESMRLDGEEIIDSSKNTITK